MHVSVIRFRHCTSKLCLMETVWLQSGHPVRAKLLHVFVLLWLDSWFYRKTLVNLTTVVETKMCSKEWDGINFNHVPSKAMTIYTFGIPTYKCIENPCNKYKESLANGTAKVNANAVFPHDVKCFCGLMVHV